ncbi:Aste57867_3305 [Aphanomyces stellatus]|uniref:Aste57867_3305 protein n=1 Tax=Aphanomyces stellatus TaxID=120398 RepID=A0A485KDR9_9STRA|nr:hypothetical protein As57867_003295 [Aphanomyces stellatus]VFT80475.1 Aste57867_3305 [Aphanomyces stellatus]
MVKLIPTNLTCLAIFATAAATTPVYDVIVVGSGPGGLVAAEYLSRNSSISVLVLEAGVPSLRNTGGSQIPDYIKPEEWTVFDIPGEYTNTAFPHNAKQTRLRLDWVASPSPLFLGKIVGGSSSLNGMLYFRTSDEYVQETKWPVDARAVTSNFAEIETMFGSTHIPSPDGHWYLQEAYTIIGNALGANGFREVNINAKCNNKSKSYGHPPFAIKNGLRDSPAKTFLGAATKRANFKLLTSATVSHILQSQGVATGVVYTTGTGQSVTVNLSPRGTVVVAAGAVSTPKVLMQSGIGPRDQLDLLAKNGNFPGVNRDASKWVVNENVGRNMFDTIQKLTTFKHPKMKAFYHDAPPKWALDQYSKVNHTGPWASPSPILIGYEYIQSNQFQVTGFCHGYEGNADPTHLGVQVYLNNPKGRTRCEFRPDGSYHFNLNGGLYSHPDDRSALDTFFGKLRGYMQGTGSTYVNARGLDGSNHYGGTCVPAIDASDPHRCADGSFKVVGTSNIFVGDASLMREGTVNPYGFVMQIGRQAGGNVQRFLAAKTPRPVHARVHPTADE